MPVDILRFDSRWPSAKILSVLNRIESDIFFQQPNIPGLVPFQYVTIYKQQANVIIQETSRIIISYAIIDFVLKYLQDKFKDPFLYFYPICR